MSRTIYKEPLNSMLRYQLDMTDSADNSKAISIQGLNKYYKKLHAVKDVSFEVTRGDFFGFLGPNGAGKTTTINVITGLSNYASGTVRVLGNDVTKAYRQTRRLVGLCGQEFNFDPFLDLHRLLIYQAGYFGINKTVASDRAEELLKKFHLWEKRKEDYRVLSGGMKRRLLICRSLIHDPEILILDEPTAGADLYLKYMIWDFLRELNHAGKTIFLTTHYMEEAETLCKSIAIIHQGRIVRIGEKDKVLQGKSLEHVFREMTQYE